MQVICTQPRAVAAQQLAARVATEYAAGDEEQGSRDQLVGRHVGSNQSHNPQKCQIKFVTEATFLTEIRNNADLSRYASCPKPCNKAFQGGVGGLFCFQGGVGGVFCFQGGVRGVFCFLRWCRWRLLFSRWCPWRFLFSSWCWWTFLFSRWCKWSLLKTVAV